MLEHHITKRPGDGFLLIREVSLGRNVIQVINDLRAGRLESDRQKLVNRNLKYFFGNPPKKSPLGMQRRRQQTADSDLRREKARAANRKALLSRRYHKPIT